MSKYLTKLINNPNYSDNSKMNIKFNFTGMSCGNGYKQGLKHRFETNDSKDVTILLEIIKRFRLGTIVTNIKEKSFEFESTTISAQIFLFRTCRYTRFSNIRKILEDTIKINNKRVGIANAFLLAHYYNYFPNNNYINNISGFNGSMDGFYDPSSNYKQYINKPFRKLSDFKNNVCVDKGITYNHIYMYKESNLKDKKTLFDFLNQNDFKAAEQFLLNIYYK